MKQLTAWSNSRLAKYDKCPAQLWYTAGEKLHEPKHPNAQRGIDVHEGVANWFNGDGPTDGMWQAKAIDQFREQMEQIAGLNPFVEEKWAFDENWLLLPYFDKRVRYRSVIDIGVMWDGGRFSLVDWKTGQPYGNNAEQVEQFAVAAFNRFRSVNWIEARLEYLDTGQEIHEEFTRAQLPALTKKWEKRAAPLLNDRTFAPRPGPHCKKCHFRKSNGGPCSFD